MQTELNDALDAKPADTVLHDLLGMLKAAQYQFVTPTPASHARVLARAPHRVASDLRDVFGWSLPFAPDLLDATLLRRLDDIGMVEPAGPHLRSLVRVSSLGPDLFLHSAYPTNDKDAVFFGPDSYRFARLIRQELARCPKPMGAKLVDVGAGAGVGAIVASHCCPQLDILMTDINPFALRLARVNAQAAGVRATIRHADEPAAKDGLWDIVVANPPFIIDDEGRDYRNGGSAHGSAVALEMARGALEQLATGGRLILYTGSAIAEGGRDMFRQRLIALAARHGCRLCYEEMDPDVFGEELLRAGYREIERIALVSAVFTRDS
ncbi:hypothetical protein FHS96_002801 [Sphingomonas zeicaulis]|uniref:methyltransferase n=1 Tax=Sphingomonas zeicaulis TaxID=1632740 RepID=UPI003D1E3316